ncbi:NAD(P)/FAD-dependent oxidoreductase [Hamadaea tsunoensis]|uniref:NAD(P)/FAD-dependent oxidoreductase n=1 Tax=Hamadaea tsunoensis TaxID=53368 RepID=UPI000482B678|nr:FAD-dependent oxidoreductase [Hamadaea tsunoensis]
MTDGPRVAVVGGGIAGALLAWRLSGHRVDVYTGPVRSDATAASGGLVRAFEADEAACRDALASLTELLGDARLREWAQYRESGSLYRLPAGDGETAAARVALIEQALPGSAEVIEPPHPLLAALGEPAVAVVERQAGNISPHALRNAALAHSGATVCPEPVAAVVADGVILADGQGRDYDAVVVSAGAWTPKLLAASGLPDPALRTKQIQYSVFPRAGSVDRPFVDDITGLYGRTFADGTLLLGLPGQRWDVDPSALTVDAPLATRVRQVAADVLGDRHTGAPDRIVVAADCYHGDPGLRLRPVPGGGSLFTFTGGSGGAAKTAVAASRTAASALLTRIDA